MPTPQPDSPVPFGDKTCWLAVRSEHGRDIAAALGIADPVPSSWKDGVEASYRGSAFVTPPIDGWTFVVGVPAAPGIEQPTAHGVRS